MPREVLAVSDAEAVWGEGGGGGEFGDVLLGEGEGLGAQEDEVRGSGREVGGE